LCSDGLSDQVESRVIQQTVESNAGNPEEAVRQLIGAANAAGGKDNVTVVLVEGESFTAPAVAWRARNAGIGDGAVYPGSRPGSCWPRRARGFRAASGCPRRCWRSPKVLIVGTGTAYPSIAAAMSAAHPGDTVEVPGGEYNEQVHLAAGVTLRSRVPREAVLRAAPLNTGAAVIGENIKGASFTGFRILAAKDLPISTGILLDNASVEVDDVEVEGAGIGIEIKGAASPVLRANSIHDCASEGVLILGDSQAWISHNDIRRNKGAGLAARDGARPALLGNVFEKNAVEVPDDLKTAAVKDQNVLLDMPPARRTLPPAKKKE
jgi:hypothetical protein